jgi:hypothetical protein
MTKATIAELEADVETHRKGYLEAIKNPPKLTAQENNLLGHTPTSLAPVTSLIERWLAIQATKIAYDEALGRLQGHRADRLSFAMAVVTAVIAFGTIAQVVVALLSHCRESCPH